MPVCFSANILQKSHYEKKQTVFGQFLLNSHVFVKTMSKKIQDGTFTYYFVRVLVNFLLRRSYKKFEIKGTENIPQDGCTLWASNHTNALMDPLVILRSTKAPKVFLARADIFKKPFVVRLLTFLKIMPIYRMRDGIDSVKRNDEIISRAVDVLTDNTPLVIFPEATHRAKHSLLKLSKGVFHIALAVNEKVAGDKPVYVLPVGVDYGDYFRFRSNVMIRFGKPINVTEFVRENAEKTQPMQMQKLKTILAERMADLITYIPDDESYDAVFEYVKLKADNPEYFKNTVAEIEKECARILSPLEKVQAVNKHAVAEILEMKDNEPDKSEDILAKVDKLRVWRIQNGVSVRSIACNVTLPKLLLKILVALLGLPYYLFCVVVCALVWAPTIFILSKVDDDAFYNTARFGVRFALSWVYVLVFALLFFKWFPLVPAIILTLLLFPSYNFFTDYREYARIIHSDVSWICKRKKAPKL